MAEVVFEICSECGSRVVAGEVCGDCGAQHKAEKPKKRPTGKHKA